MAFIYLAILRRLKLNYELRTFAYIIDRSFYHGIQVFTSS